MFFLERRNTLPIDTLSGLPPPVGSARCRKAWTLALRCEENGGVRRSHSGPNAVEEPSIHAVQETACVRS